MRILFSIWLVMSSIVVFSQQPPVIKFGKITVRDLESRSYAIDTSAPAVVISDIGMTQIKGNKKGWFSLEFKRHKRIHILHKTAYGLATVEVPLYTVDELEENLSDIKAVSYNLENGKVVETKLEKTEIYKEKKDKNTIIKKFTLPNVKEGTIIEYEYKVTSDFLFNLRSWEFQGSIPRIYSEYKVGLPQFLNYTLISQGNQLYYLKDQVDKLGEYSVVQQKELVYGLDDTERLRISCGVTEFRWAMKDVPAMKDEAFTTTLDNYIAKLEFQLSGYLEPLIPENILTTWPDVARKILNREDFGVQISGANFWLDDVMKPLLKNAATDKDKAHRIYNYVRDNINCTSHSQLYTEQPIKDVLKNKNGGVAEINLLLTAMLRHAGLAADPVILSTRENGFVHPMFPLISRFNYVISRIKINDTYYFLDASYSRLGFAQLDNKCYNGQARVIDENGTEINLSPDLNIEHEETTVALVNDISGQWKGNVKRLFGDFKSFQTRNELQEIGKDNYLKKIATGFGSDIKADDLVIDSLFNYDEPVKVAYSIQFNDLTEDLLYISPVFNGSLKQNPFKSTERQYPVEMPYRVNEIYKLNMTVPAGYVVDELPKPLLLKLTEKGDAVFEYTIKQTGDIISLISRLEVNKTVFYPAEYIRLRDFYAKIIAKQNEQIVFKKKK